MKSLTRLVLPDIKDMLEHDEMSQLGEELTELHPADVADIVETLDASERLRLFDTLPEDYRAQVFEHLQDAIRTELFEQLDRRGAAKLLEGMASDERTDVLKDIEEGERNELINLLEAPERKEARELLSYPEGSAGAAMTKEFVRVPPETTASETMARIRAVASEMETVYYIYVVDQGGRLHGVVSMRDLVMADPMSPVEKIMGRDVVTSVVTEDQEEVAKKIANYDFLAIPVLDADGRMLGIITHDDVVDILREEQTEDVQRMGAVEPLDMPYLTTDFWTLFRKRVFWLCVLFLGELLSANVLTEYRDWSAYAVLSIFIPLILSSGGNSGNQSATLVIRGFATGELVLSQWLVILWRELRMGLALGAVLGAIGVGRALLVGHNSMVTAITVGSSLVVVVTGGTMVGALLPLVFRRCGIDPAVTSNPFVASLCDILGLFLYFSMAKVVLSMVGH